MKTKNLFLLPALIAGLGLTLAGRVRAQTLTTLHTFTALSHGDYGTNSDGVAPNGLFLSGNTLYGTARLSGPSDGGTVFKVNTDGTGFTILHSFTARSTSSPYTNSDGAIPEAGLILSGNTLYGTAAAGGSGGAGTVFAINTDGTGFTILHSFTHPRGAPNNLVLSGNTLYGSARGGTVFAINTDGTGFTTLYSFSDGGSDGISLNDLVLSGNTLYGTAAYGGSSGNGTVFAVNTDGTDFTVLHSFTEPAPDPQNGPNSDGARPRAGLILSGSTLYGTAERGGTSGRGTVFAVNTDGTGFTVLHSFTAPAPDPYTGTNSDGATPGAGLMLSGNTLYGTAAYGGSSGWGTVFAINTDGTGFTTLHNFTGGSNGGGPDNRLILAGDTLYGTGGVVYSLSFRPQLSITPSGAFVIFTWPTNVAGFDYTGYTLQSTTNLVSPAVWTTVSPGPVVIDGQNAVTNLMSGTQQFYRLSQ